MTQESSKVELLIKAPTGYYGRRFSSIVFAGFWLKRHAPTTIIPQAWRDK